MRKMIALLLAAMMVFTLAACGQRDDAAEDPGTDDVIGTEPADMPIDGGYSPADSPVITDEIRALVEKASAGLTGAVYTPVAYIASQVVAGTNHLILCKVTPVVPDATANYALVTVYEDLNGSAEITDVNGSKAEAPAAYNEDNPVAGGFAEPDSVIVSDEAKEALVKACETLTGAEYEPVALLATQIVAGVNYKMLCKATPTVPDPEVYYTIVTVYADLSGNAEITETFDFATER